VNYSSFLRRFFALIIDVIILAIAYTIISLPMPSNKLISIAAAAFIYWLYYALLESSKYQATAGKLIMGIKVINSQGEKLNFGRAAARSIVKVLSSFTNILFIVCLFTRNRQCLHDFAAKSYVVYKNPDETAGDIDNIVRPFAVIFAALYVISIAAGFVMLKKFGISLKDAYSYSALQQNGQDSDSLLNWQTVNLPDINLSLDSPVSLARDSGAEDGLLSDNINNNTAQAVCYKSGENIFLDLKIQYITFFTEVSASDAMNWAVYKEFLRSPEITETEIAGLKALRAKGRYGSRMRVTILAIPKDERSAWIIKITPYTDDESITERIINSLKLK